MGEPIEREGTVFAPEDMLYYNGELPDREPDRIFTAVDPAFGGGDYTSAPIVCQYDKDFYVVDVVFSNAERGVTQPMLARKAKEWNIGAMQIEASKAIRPFAEGVQEEMEKVGYKLTIVTKPAPPNLAKSARILDKAGTIRSSFYFLDSNHRTKEYNLFMQNLFSYKLEGKELLAAPLMPCFGRAVTENDLGAWLQRRMGAWLYPEFRVRSLTREDG